MRSLLIPAVAFAVGLTLFLVGLPLALGLPPDPLDEVVETLGIILANATAFAICSAALRLGLPHGSHAALAARGLLGSVVWLLVSAGLFAFFLLLNIRLPFAGKYLFYAGSPGVGAALLLAVPGRVRWLLPSRTPREL